MGSGNKKAKIVKLPNILKLEDRKLQLTENIYAIEERKEKESALNIKKIDISMFEQGEAQDNNPNLKDKSEIRKQYCENLKQFFEKNISEEQEKEKELRNRIERENKKREVAKQIQEELRRINGLNKKDSFDQ